MSKNLESKTMEQLLAEADELLGKINSDVTSEMEEEHRLQVEIQAQNLEKIKSEIHKKIEKAEISNADHGAEGMHEAFQDITKAMRDLMRFLS